MLQNNSRQQTRQYSQAIRRTLEAAMTMQQFGSQLVERHTKPEVEVRTSREALGTPVVIARNAQERILIEPSVNSLRVSVSFKKVDYLEVYLAANFVKFMEQRAEDFFVIRRKPMKGYDITFLITAAHAEKLKSREVVDFVLHFMADVDKQISDMKLLVNSRARLRAEECFSV